jgi:hypothetical protein
MVEGSRPATQGGSAPEHHARRVLSDVRRHLQKSALKLLGYLVAAYVVLKLIPRVQTVFCAIEACVKTYALPETA